MKANLNNRWVRADDKVSQTVAADVSRRKLFSSGFLISAD